MESAELGTTVLSSQSLLQLADDEEPSETTFSQRLITTEEAFEKLAPHWRKLAEETDTTIFMTHEWAVTWWRNFGQNSRRSLAILTYWEEDTLIGLAPFYKGYSSVGGAKIETRLQILGSGGSPNEQLGYMDDYGISDFLDILVLKEYRSKVADLLSDMIQQNTFGVDVINFHQARDDSFIMNYLYPRLQKTDLDLQLEHTDTCPYIELSDQDSLKGYIKSVKSSARRRFRQSLRAVNQKDELDLIELETWEEVERAIETMISLHQDRWNKIGFPGVFYDKRFIQFFRETVRYAFDNGWLWFKEMKDDEGVCAARMLLHYNGRFYDYISGFNDERKSSKYRPGIGLLVEAVRDAIEGGAKTVELLRGEEGYKYDFTDKNFRNWRLSVNVKNNRNRVENTVCDAMRMLALFYKRTTRELRLMNVQRQQNGMFKMLPEYISFRWKSLQMKRD